MFKDWPPPDRLPDGVIYWTDSGFQGLRTDYPQCPVIQPQTFALCRVVNSDVELQEAKEYRADPLPSIERLYARAHRIPQGLR
jgi:hypothetical protein